MMCLPLHNIDWRENMADERAKYGTGTIYKQGNSYIAQLYHSIEIEGKTYNKRISGSGKTETKAVRNRNRNIKNGRKN